MPWPNRIAPAVARTRATNNRPTRRLGRRKARRPRGNPPPPARPRGYGEIRPCPNQISQTLFGGAAREGSTQAPSAPRPATTIFHSASVAVAGSTTPCCGWVTAETAGDARRASRVRPSRSSARRSIGAAAGTGFGRSPKTLEVPARRQVERQFAHPERFARGRVTGLSTATRLVSRVTN